MKLNQIEDVQRQLLDNGVGQFSQLLTVAQAAVVLAVIPRRVRLLCQEGRLGTQVGGGPWIVQREELIEYLERDHSSGQAGRDAALVDRLATEDRYGSLTVA